MDLIMRLPFDLAVMAIKRLSIKDIYQCSLVCRSWHKLFTDDSILYPLLLQLSHFDQEPVLFHHLPNDHASHADRKDDPKSEGKELEESDAITSDLDESPETIRLKLEEGANQLWIKNNRVLTRIFQKVLNREHRWHKGQPTTRLYLPPVPLDGTDSDIKEEWQGPVKIIKMKGGIVAALYEEGKSIRLWNLVSNYDEIKTITDRYIAENAELLKAQTKYDGPALPPFTESDISAFLKCSQSGVPRKAVLSVIRLRKKPILFDFQTINNLLVTAASDGDVDLYDLNTCKHLRTFTISDTRDTIGTVHVWIDFIVVGHGTHITLWNHRSGKVLEDALPTAHRANITGAFVLDNENHLLSIDETGIIVVTDRSAKNTETDTLLDTPMYPMFMVGKMGAPYAMRLLHMSHLCVWGRYTFGHYELYEPGLRNLPPLSTLLVNMSDDFQTTRITEDETTGHSRSEPQENQSGEDRSLSEARRTLAQLETTQIDLERMYSHIAGDIDNEHPEGLRLERQRLNTVPAERRYHMISIDPPFENGPEGKILTVDFRRALYMCANSIQICDLEKSRNGTAIAVSLGLFPTEPLSPRYGPKKPSSTGSGGSGAGSSPNRASQNAAFRISDYLHGGRFAQALQGEGVSEEMRRVFVEAFQGQTGEEEFEEMHRVFMEAFQRHGDENSEDDPVGPYESIDLENSTLVQLETLFMRYISDIRGMKENPAYIPESCTPEQLQEAREYMKLNLPELVAVIDSDETLRNIRAIAPYYIQRLFETRFNKPILNVDHRGQKVGVQQLWRDMDRVHAITHARERRTDSRYLQGDIMPPSVGNLRLTSTALDDGRIAVGCKNGYVVVVSTPSEDEAAAFASASAAGAQQQGSRTLRNERSERSSSYPGGPSRRRNVIVRYSPYANSPSAAASQQSPGPNSLSQNSNAQATLAQNQGTESDANGDRADADISTVIHTGDTQDDHDEDTLQMFSRVVQTVANFQPVSNIPSSGGVAQNSNSQNMHSEDVEMAEADESNSQNTAQTTSSNRSSTTAAPPRSRVRAGNEILSRIIGRSIVDAVSQELEQRRAVISSMDAAQRQSATNDASSETQGSAADTGNNPTPISNEAQLASEQATAPNTIPLVYRMGFAGRISLYRHVSNFILSILEPGADSSSANNAAFGSSVPLNINNDIASSLAEAAAADSGQGNTPNENGSAQENISQSSDLPRDSQNMRFRMFLLPEAIDQTLEQYEQRRINHGQQDRGPSTNGEQRDGSANNIIDENDDGGNNNRMAISPTFPDNEPDRHSQQPSLAEAIQATPNIIHTRNASPSAASDVRRRVRQSTRQEELERLRRMVRAMHDERLNLPVPVIILGMQMRPELQQTLRDQLSGPEGLRALIPSSDGIFPTSSAAEAGINASTSEAHEINSNNASDESSSEPRGTREEYGSLHDIFRGIRNRIGRFMPSIANSLNAWRQGHNYPTSTEGLQTERTADSVSEGANSTSQPTAPIDSSGDESNENSEDNGSASTASADNMPMVSAYLTIQYTNLGNPLLLHIIASALFSDLVNEASNTNASSQSHASGNDYDILIEISNIIGQVMSTTVSQDMVDKKLAKYRYEGIAISGDSDKQNGKAIARLILERDDDGDDDDIGNGSKACKHPDIISLLAAERCPVCLEDFNVGETLRVLGCHHALHQVCGDSWFTQGSNMCPVCRAQAVNTIAN
ncbi:E3 ubiquitin-protein ligase rnf13 [Coemansia spiralis]|uniref:E3 ubiquitin-protein ligase rnf13 n=1 Tax=Coemansia spiralis TaxID=417178 RepID=A0A9W8KZ13_9FUNG|nr:E3 ubiquitin-protein ligase rnf13 [Coemansia sp. RSA 1358]KAJ2678967.1 E3 ubiquitin-protein ligase rnf13 [Coemansia spiralis]